MSTMVPKFTEYKSTRDTSKVWILPDGKILALDTMHYRWCLDHSDWLRTTYGIDFSPVNNLEEQPVRLHALRHGMTRGNYQHPTGFLTVETNGRFFNDCLKDAIRQLVAQNAEALDSFKINILDDCGQLLNQGFARLFPLDDCDKALRLPLLDEDQPQGNPTKKAKRGLRAKGIRAAGPGSGQRPGVPQSEPILRVDRRTFNKANGESLVSPQKKGKTMKQKNQKEKGPKKNLLKRRLTEDPGSLRLSETEVADDTHPSAQAFAVIHRVIATTHRTHPWIFNALRKALDNPGKAATIFRDYDVVFVPQNPEAEDLAWFAKHNIYEMGQQREATQSGRVWKNINVEGHQMSVLSFWSVKGETSPEIVDKIVTDLKLKNPVYVEYQDSQMPEIYPGRIPL